MNTYVSEKKPRVDPSLYSKEYFLTDNEGWREYAAGLADHIHPKFKRAIELALPTKSDNILDIGCGRGELLYYCARYGAKAFGIDYSPAAIAITRQTLKRLTQNERKNTSAEVGDPTTYDFRDNKYTIIFMIETLEHMHDWQLKELFSRVGDILTEDGRLIVITPNYYYEKYLLPIKRILNLPWNVLKIPIRMTKSKYRKSGFGALLSKAFRIWPDRGDLNRKTHVNVTTPAKVKRLLKDFEASIWCEDHSRNIISLLMRRWWGRDIVAIARKR
ncbi:MAG: class I SAM-dependent methyltransferase [Candidatus Omnitrophica bacterium]|nr:class I SAM-dependent methyltransferase [Candidatus Omnitrophota bacterium]